MYLGILLLILFFSYILVQHCISEMGPVYEGMTDGDGNGSNNSSGRSCDSQSLPFENKGNIDSLEKSVQDLMTKVQVALPEITNKIKINEDKIKEIEQEAKNAIKQVEGNAKANAAEADAIEF